MREAKAALDARRTNRVPDTIGVPHIPVGRTHRVPDTIGVPHIPVGRTPHPTVGVPHTLWVTLLVFPTTRLLLSPRSQLVYVLQQMRGVFEDPIRARAF